MKGCDHDVVYSGQTNLDRKFAYICRRCGECGWDTRYVMAQVSFDEYCRQRVIHGWARPNPSVTTVPGGWRAQQAHVAERRRGWRLPLVANTLALLATALAWHFSPALPHALYALPIFGVLIGVSLWKVRHG